MAFTHARTHARTHTMYMCVRIHACIYMYKKCNRFIIMRLIITKYITNKYTLYITNTLQTSISYKGKYLRNGKLEIHLINYVIM